VCVLGDVQEQYNSTRDPRVLMGNYLEFNSSNVTYDEDVVDTSVPIYEHINFAEETGTDKQIYLFKVNDVGDSGGWVLSATLPLSGVDISVYMTCFQESLFDCLYSKWFWGYNKYEYAIPTLKVNGGECASGLCLQNLTIQLSNDPTYEALDGEFNRSYDNDTGRYQWRNLRDDSYYWYYRVYESTYNWVLSDGNQDRVACSPGYVEMPLYCTTFVYAGSVNGTSLNPDLSGDHLGLVDDDEGTMDTTWKLGGCAVTTSPTMEPTTEPSTSNPTSPTMEPTATNSTPSAMPTPAPVSTTTTSVSPDDTESAGANMRWTTPCALVSFAVAFLRLL
jgi:hypothetical protein